MRFSPPLLLTLSLLSPLAACGDDPTVEPNPDAAEPEPDAEVSTPEPETITIHAEGAELLAVREGDGAWRTVEIGANGDGTADVRGPYTAVSVCDVEGFFNYYTVHAAPSDGALQMYCTGDAIEFVSLTIDPAQVGRVFIGNRSALANGSITLRAGTYAVIAIDDSVTPPRVAVRRDVALDADQTVSVDLADAVPMNDTTVVLTDTGKQAAYSMVRLIAGGTTARLSGDDPHLFPPSLMVTGDRQLVAVSDGEGAISRGAYVNVEGDETSVAITLPAGISNVVRTTDGDVTVTWQGTDPWENRYFYVTDADFSTFWDVSVFPGYVAANPDNEIVLPDPSAVPGWDAAWGAPTAALDLWVGLNDDDAAGGRSANYDSLFAERTGVQPPRAVMQRAGLLDR